MVRPIFTNWHDGTHRHSEPHWTERDAVCKKHLCVPLNRVVVVGAYWRHLASTIELSVCNDDAALCQTTFATCYYYLELSMLLCLDNNEAVSNMTDGDVSSGQIVVVDADAVVGTGSYC